MIKNVGPCVIMGSIVAVQRSLPSLFCRYSEANEKDLTPNSRPEKPNADQIKCFEIHHAVCRKVSVDPGQYPGVYLYLPSSG